MHNLGVFSTLSVDTNSPLEQKKNIGSQQGLNMLENLTSLMGRLTIENLIFGWHRPQATAKGRLVVFHHPDLEHLAIDRLQAMIHVADGHDAAQALPEMVACYEGMRLPFRSEVTEVQPITPAAKQKWPELFNKE